MPAAETPNKRRRVGLSGMQLVELRAEQAVANAMGLGWKERGPPGPEQGGPEEWRGQRYRASTGRWANRGGKWRDWYGGLYRARAKGPEAVSAFLREHPKEKAPAHE